MPIISSSPAGIICSSPAWKLIFKAVLIACYASLVPSSVCFDAQYEICQSTGSTCGTRNFSYPFGVGNCGCGRPGFQIVCVQNSTSVISINGRNYIILELHHRNILHITRGENCQFLDDPINMPISASEYAYAFNIKGKQTRSLNVYKCNITFQGAFGSTEGRLFKCNASFYYAMYAPSLLNPRCSLEKQVFVELEKIQWVSNDKKGDDCCKSCEASGGICGYNTSNLNTPFLCYCKDGFRTDKCPGRGRPTATIITGCSVGGVALVVVLSLIHHLKNRKAPSSRGLPRPLPGREMGNLPIFSYEALCQATNCFHQDNEIGVGGFGSVYLGKVWDGRTVAVKRLYQNDSRSLEQFINEVQIFSTLNHPHLVRLYGCSTPDSPELLLVYEFIPNGTLADHLHGDSKTSKRLSWDARLNIAIQTAQALVFLHGVDPPIFHRDVKSSNILLDDNLDVKLADFGLCRLVPVDASHITTIPQGTPGYVDPEYYQCYQLTEKSDVYSFGVVLAEIISAKIAMDINRNKREINLANLAVTKIQEGVLDELVDSQLDIEVNHKVKVMVSAVAELAFRCLASEGDDRPLMKQVLSQLQGIRRSSGTSTGSGERQLESFSNINQPNTAPLSHISVQDK